MRKQMLLAMLLACGTPAIGFGLNASAAPMEQSQNVATINGTVLDENNEPVIGASVAQKGNASNAAVTDVDGHFKIRVAAGTPLVVSYVGYKAQEIAAAKDMVVYLQPTTANLDQLVVVGYGSQKKANLTGAVSTVDVARVMESRSTADVSKALQGAVPGLTITTTTGDINATPKLRIRGTGTLSNDATSNPLIVIDGVISDDLSTLNPDDIAEISVMKDAASSSIYGSRAAFGVILITTKTPAKQDKVSLKYSNNFGWSGATTLPDYPDVETQLIALTEANLAAGGEVGLFGMNAFEMMPLARQWKINNGGKKAKYREMQLYKDDKNVGDYKLQANGQGLYYADWDVAGIMFNSHAPSSQHNVSLEGTSGKTQYRLAFGYSDKQDLLAWNPTKMSRYNATANISTQVFSWLKAGVRMTFTEKDYKGVLAQGVGNYNYMWRWGSYFGPYGWSYDADGQQTDYRNMIAFQKQGGKIKDAFTQSRNTAWMDFTPIKGLTIHGDFTYNVENLLNTTSYLPVYMFNSWGNIEAATWAVCPPSDSDARQTNTKQDSWTMNVYGTYERDLFKDFNFKVMFGGSAEHVDYNYLYAKRDILLDVNKPYLGLTTGGTNKTGYTITNTISHRATAGYFGRINLDYKGIYLLEFNGRYDGSSRFPANQQWGFFPSGSLGYRFTEEAYFKPYKQYVSNGKIRASYGSIGNEAIGSNKFISVIGTPTATSWLNAGGATEMQAGMPTIVSSSLTWEKVVTANVGIDLGFLNNSLTASFDWYNRETRDMLGPGISAPSTLGASAPYGNNGTLRTNGWEIALGWNHSFGDADVYATATLADARTKITKWTMAVKDKLYSWYPSQTNYTEGGYYGDIYGFETERYFEKSDMDENGRPKQDQSYLESGSFKYGVGDIMFRDLNGDGKINDGYANCVRYNGKLYAPGIDKAAYDELMARAKNDKELAKLIETVGVGTKDNHGDLKVIGNSQPRFEYGIRLGGAWKGFDIDAFFQGIGKRDYWAVGAFIMPFARGTDALYSNQTSYNQQVINYDTQKLTGEIIVNQGNRYPRLYPGSDGGGKVSGINNGRYNFYPQSRYLLNMAYLRFKTLTCGYTLPYDITKKALIQKARIYFAAENLCFLYNGMKDYPIDPEIQATSNANMGGNGYYGRVTPMAHTYSFGIQVTF